MSHLRQATLQDIPVIQAIAEIAFRHTYREILSPSQMEYMMDWMYSTESLRRQITELGHTFLILTSPEGTDVGYVSFNQETSPSATSLLFHLQKIYLLPQMQGKGYGALLFQAAETQMRHLAGDAPARFELNVNRNNRAVSFYLHMGMHKDREGDFPIGHDFYMNDYIMAKELPI